ncbi:MAG: hypothetical protein ACYTFY_01445 [Planctomycetota bacterium]
MSELSNFKQKSKLALKKAICIGVSAHLILFAVCCLLFYKELSIKFTPEQSNHTSNSLENNLSSEYTLIENPDTDNSGVGIENFNVKKRIINEINEKYLNLDKEKQTESLKKAVELTQKVSKDAVPEIASIMNIESRKYQPVKNNKHMPFDHNNVSIENMRKISNTSGESGYSITLVDQNGITKELKVYGRKSRVYDSAYPIFKLAEENPAFAEIYHKLVKPILSDLAKEMKKNSKSSAAIKPNGEK